jgi:hypothetical protein
MKFLMLIILVSFNCSASCPIEKEMVAGENIEKISSWEELAIHHGKYRACDDGYIAEGYSEVVSLLLANNWGNLKVAKWSHDFKKFVVEHIDETWGIKNYKKAHFNARTKCTTELSDICLAITSLPKDSFNQEEP